MGIAQNKTIHWEIKLVGCIIQHLLDTFWTADMNSLYANNVFLKYSFTNALLILSWFPSLWKLSKKINR